MAQIGSRISVLAAHHGIFFRPVAAALYGAIGAEGVGSAGSGTLGASAAAGTEAEPAVEAGSAAFSVGSSAVEPRASRERFRRCSGISVNVASGATWCSVQSVCGGPDTDR
jgi:hypothetical protein